MKYETIRLKLRKLYIKNTKAKILLGLAKGKKNYDKRESIKQRDIDRYNKKTMKY